jgi:hypothetical protein
LVGVCVFLLESLSKRRTDVFICLNVTVGRRRNEMPTEDARSVPAAGKIGTRRGI